MKRITYRKFLFLLLLYNFCSGQIGIGTVAPAGALDITSTNDGLLIPRISLTATNVATVVTPTVSELVYNTNTSAAGANQVTPGYYYWNGTVWVRLAIASTTIDNWALLGNAGTVAGTNFLGTTDAVDIRFKTNSLDRWNISNANNGQLQSYSLGSATIPTYSFQGDQNTGIFSSAADNLDFSTGGSTRLRIPAADQIHALALGTAALPFYSFATDSNTGIFSPSADALSVATNGIERTRVDASGRFVVGATTANAMLDVNSANEGFLIPRLALTATNSALPLTLPTTSEMVYNTATAGTAPNSVTPGYYYWDGTVWVRLATGANSDWALTGNAGTVAGTNFLGTTDAVDVRIKTNGADRWNISNANNGQLQSYSLGTATIPTYSFQGDQNTGIFSSAADNLDLSTGGATRLRIPAADQIHALALGTAALPFYSFAADSNTGIFSPSADALSVATNGIERARVDASGRFVVGATTANAMLDVNSANEGFLIPRLALTATNSALPLTLPTTSEMVYNTATAGTAPNSVTPGYYYWDGTVWVRMATGPNSDWALTGNAGTVAGTNFLGTTDAIDVRIKTNGTDRWNISNANNGQLQSYSLGTAALPTYSFQANPNTGLFSPAANTMSLSTNGVEGLRLGATSNVAIGATYASTNAAPTNGLRVQGAAVVGKASGEDSRDITSSHTAATSYVNLTGYQNNTAKRAIAGYADASGIGVLGTSNATGYGLLGLTKATISTFVKSGVGVTGQADGTNTTITPIGLHGVIDETVTGNWKATGLLGENNTLTPGVGFYGGAYNSAGTGASSGVYGNIGSRVTTAGALTPSYMFGVIGDVLTTGTGTAIPNASGGVLGYGGNNNFGILGYRGTTGIVYSVYGAGAIGGIALTNSGSRFANNDNASVQKANNHIGLGITGGFMGGYIAGSEYGMFAHGREFGSYIQGKTIVNEPIVKLTDNGSAERTATYVPTSTEIDVMTRGKGQLQNGTAFIAFKKSFAQSVASAETINVTVTPTQETKGVFVSRVTEEGFYITENASGTSNASFNWVAVGTQKGFENGVEISETVKSRDFDQKMIDVITSEKQSQGKPIYFDGQNVRFDRIPESMVPSSRKEQAKN